MNPDIEKRLANLNLSNCSKPRDQENIEWNVRVCKRHTIGSIIATIKKVGKSQRSKIREKGETNRLSHYKNAIKLQASTPKLLV